MIAENNLASDVYIPIFRNNPNTGGGVGPNKMVHSLAEKEDWESMKLDHPEYGFNQPWGPGIMYEMAIPLALYLGCNKIVFVCLYPLNVISKLKIIFLVDVSTLLHN